jgi:hypothetical protein
MLHPTFPPFLLTEICMLTVPQSAVQLSRCPRDRLWWLLWWHVDSVVPPQIPTRRVGRTRFFRSNLAVYWPYRLAYCCLTFVVFFTSSVCASLGTLCL